MYAEVEHIAQMFLQHLALASDLSMATWVFGTVPQKENVKTLISLLPPW